MKKTENNIFISGFTFVRNGDKFYFPVKESILSILPIVDEFIIALGDNDPDDRTQALIESINSPKIKVIHRVWDEAAFVKQHIFRDETNFALSQCKGEWCFYLQADEVIHEKDWDTIVSACKNAGDDIDGLLFDYFHFWGDYDHYLPYHGWYKNEIRVVRNNRNVQSIKDAQSFRINGKDKLKVKRIGANVYHYGWVRPPRLMQAKKKEQDGMHWGKEKAEQMHQASPLDFDYGPLGKIPLFKGSHPKVMDDYRKELSWKAELNYSKQETKPRKKNKHDSFKVRFLSFIENNFLGGREIFGYSNWVE